MGKKFWKQIFDRAERLGADDGKDERQSADDWRNRSAAGCEVNQVQRGDLCQ
jgi:hypothetical protein